MCSLYVKINGMFCLGRNFCIDICDFYLFCKTPYSLSVIKVITGDTCELTGWAFVEKPFPCYLLPPPSWRLEEPTRKFKEGKGNKEGRGSVGLPMNSMHIRCQPKEVNQLTKGHLDHLWNWSPGINSLFFFCWRRSMHQVDSICGTCWTKFVLWRNFYHLPVIEL